MSAAERLPPRSSDERLVERVLAGEREAFDELYVRYLPRVFRFVDKRLRNRADVEETTQEVFINVFSSLGSFRAEAPFAAWVLGIARRTVANRFKKRQHPTVPLDGESEVELETELLPGAASRAPTPYELYALRERVAHLQEVAERRLSPEQRRLFELHHLEHQTISEIAQILDKSEDAVKSNLYRARKLLFAR